MNGVGATTSMVCMVAAGCDRYDSGASKMGRLWLTSHLSLAPVAIQHQPPKQTSTKPTDSTTYHVIGWLGFGLLDLNS